MQLAKSRTVLYMETMSKNRVLGLLCLTSLSTIFQLYLGGCLIIMSGQIGFVLSPLPVIKCISLHKENTKPKSAGIYMNNHRIIPTSDIINRLFRCFLSDRD